ncbi:MAG TPA: sigma factor [Plantibacter sp.]|uniref:sigma factor n=1 Tax=Plantibacter sp. TaxID=1871045 RepID=UPI002CA570F3|nr:sigma factor [Plantibacter sp.]
MTMLHGRLELHGVDVEKLAHRAVNAYLTGRRAHLQAADREDLVAYVTAELWRASLTYDSERSSGFSTYAYRLAGARSVDWFRLRFGRTKWQFGDGTVYERARQTPLSLDHVGPDGLRLADGLPDRASDREEDRATALAGLLDERGRSFARDHELIHSAVARRARSRDRRARAA